MSDMDSISDADMQIASVDAALEYVNRASSERYPHVMTSAARILANEIVRYREIERQRWETAKGWYISSMASSRGELGLPPRVPVIPEE